jgi:hypothetical protein
VARQGGGGRASFCYKVPRQCPLVRLVEVRLREGKALQSGKRQRVRMWTV